VLFSGAFAYQLPKSTTSYVKPLRPSVSLFARYSRNSNGKVFVKFCLRLSLNLLICSLFLEKWIRFTWKRTYVYDISPWLVFINWQILYSLWGTKWCPDMRIKPTITCRYINLLYTSKNLLHLSATFCGQIQGCVVRRICYKELATSL